MDFELSEEHRMLRDFEDLIQQPQPTLTRLGEFLQHELDYSRIQQVGYGSARVFIRNFHKQFGLTPLEYIKSGKDRPS